MAIGCVAGDILSSKTKFLRGQNNQKKTSRPYKALQSITQSKAINLKLLLQSTQFARAFSFTLRHGKYLKR